MNKVELLAPAGSLDICKAVINAGADAVYLGGQMFGARAFAHNFTVDEIKEALDYAHNRGAKIYLTVNTLLKNDEIYRAIEYLKPLYEYGLDAVLVQDMGLMRLLKLYYPDMAIHISTQMNVTGEHFLKYLRECGAERVVLARELTLDEIRHLHDECDIELEVFIHGALCYCYSGQCFMSYEAGGRSANKGACAGPCRLPYKSESGETGYLLSPKDLMSIQSLPDILDSGVASLKIEGRMKNIKYAAGITHMYREYIDKYYAYGRKGYVVNEKDVNDILDLYNRGFETTGYFYTTKSRDMMSLSRPNHMGTKALEVIENKKGNITFKALEPINHGDVFEIDRENSFTSGKDLNVGEFLNVNLPSKYKLGKGTILYRVNNARIEGEILRDFVENGKEIYLSIDIAAIKNEPIRVTVSTYNELLDEYIYATAEGAVVQPAENRPVTEDDLLKKASKLGGTQYSLVSAQAHVDGDIFIAIGDIGKVRNKAIELLENEIRARFARRYNAPQEEDTVVESHKSEDAPFISAQAYKLEQADVLADAKNVSRMYISYHCIYEYRNKQWKLKDDAVKVVERAKEHKKEVFIALPAIARESNVGMTESLLESILNDSFSDGMLIRNMEELLIYKEYVNKNKDNCAKKIVLDSNIYVYNKETKIFLLEEYRDMCIDRIASPIELDENELSDLVNEVPMEMELTVYGKVAVMQSEQCIKKTLNTCDHLFGMESIIQNGSNKHNNAKNNVSYSMLCLCDYCFTTIFDYRARDIDISLAKKLDCGSIRYDFTTESADEVMEICNKMPKAWR